MNSINLKHQLLHYVIPIGLTALLCLAVQPVRADVAVDLTATPLGGGIFQYEFAVSNNGPDDVPILSIVDAPAADPLIGATLQAPAGFAALYDPGAGMSFGFVDALEGTQLFAAGTTTGGFRFESAGSPPAFFSKFEALTVNGDFLSGTISFNSSVPETGSTLLMAGLGLTALPFLRRKS